MGRHDQAALLAEIARTQPYTFTDETPKESTLQGAPVYELRLKVDVDKLVALNRLAAKRLGVPMPSWKYTAPQKAKTSIYYIPKDTHRLLNIREIYGTWRRFDYAQQHDSTRTLHYRKYSAVQVIPPKP